ncbi:efflux RND transporter permease subunit [Staphylococcus caledonicus]|uniref:efflux RND transporter permease subunit n=1 Tax=Staphylococcus caledonicus TaxID=2741333 RepID=UPI0018E40F32|nr:efflux RND transporter permease subunit [Staphylococcus caledonicus]MBI5973926.1 efflux RND transporter permease subunit [Staphylococcus caledonicus]
MPNNNQHSDKFEEASRLRRNVVTSVLAVLVVIAGIFAYQQYTSAQEMQSKVDKRIEQNNKMNKENKKVEEANDELKKQIGVYDTDQSSKKFYDKFFNWSTWKEYMSNMKQLQVLYPSIEEGNVVNIKGDKRGASASPESSYSRESYIGKEKSQVGDIVKQTKMYPDGEETEAIWYIISDYKDDKYNITKMKAYRVAQ